jgi:hypothetical protein
MMAIGRARENRNMPDDYTRRPAIATQAAVR